MNELEQLRAELQAARKQLLQAYATRPGGRASIVQQTDEHVQIGGYGIIFDVPGLEGTRFDRNTSLKLPGQQGEGLFAVEPTPVYWDHGFDEVIEITNFGAPGVIEQNVDEKGIWIRAQLDRSQDYMDWVLELMEDEDFILGLSAGSTSHLNAWIEWTRVVWPVIEMSMTPTPAQPRTLGVEVMQSLSPDTRGLLDRYTVRQSLPSQDGAPSTADPESAVQAAPPEEDAPSAEAEAAQEEPSGAASEAEPADVTTQAEDPPAQTEPEPEDPDQAVVEADLAAKRDALLQVVAIESEWYALRRAEMDQRKR